MLLAVVRFHFFYYPHGMRSGKLPTFMLTLSAYAEDHDGWYPRGEPSPLESLQKLYPEYARAELAGLSGSEKGTVERLKSGRALDGRVSSWIYVPGFRQDDDPSICIIWESWDGIFVNGSRHDGHAVGFVGGGYDQIPSTNWASFLKRQEDLRKSVLSKRSSAIDERK